MFLDLIKDKITALSNYACTNEWDRNWVYELIIEKIINELSRGEICVANFKAPCEWCEFGQVFNGQSEWWYGPFVKTGCCQTTLNGPIPKTFYTGGWICAWFQ